MLKKVYQKPKAGYIVFYSDQEITSNLPIENYANEDETYDANGGVSGSLGTGDIRPGVPID